MTVLAARTTVSNEFRSISNIIQSRIEHTTTYRYHQPVRFGQHRLVLRPREGHDLRVNQMEIQISPSHNLEWAHDIYNNSVAIVTFNEVAAQLEIRSSVIVERDSGKLPPANHHSSPVPLVVAYDVLEAPVIAVYQTVSYPDDLISVRNWVQQYSGTNSATNADSMLSDLCSLICQRIQYQRRYAKGVQSPAQTIRLGTGSCRDLATLMMEAARGIGFAARFASGYLDCPASEAGRAAMHAWTEVYLPTVGWRGYDPTLGEPVSRKHILVGVSHHPRGVMPVSGMFTGLSGDFIDMTAHVKIERLTGSGQVEND